jgi:Na+-transporting methylmalonyl-CoA/oxaloacetate decarboxylase gamma subunit
MEVEVVWSVIILLCCGLAFTLYCVAYILIMAYKEMSDVQSKEQGISEQQEAESRECDSKESKEWR